MPEPIEVRPACRAEIALGATQAHHRIAVARTDRESQPARWHRHGPIAEDLSVRVAYWRCGRQPVNTTMEDSSKRPASTRRHPVLSSDRRFEPGPKSSMCSCTWPSVLTRSPKNTASRPHDSMRVEAKQFQPLARLLLLSLSKNIQCFLHTSHSPVSI